VIVLEEESSSRLVGRLPFRIREEEARSRTCSVPGPGGVGLVSLARENSEVLTVGNGNVLRGHRASTFCGSSVISRPWSFGVLRTLWALRGSRDWRLKLIS
jgi:hypothetical protein